MRTEQRFFDKDNWTTTKTDSEFDPRSAQLVLAFGSVARIENTDLRNAVRAFYPYADICWCSTAGEISSRSVSDNSLVVTAIQLQATPVKAMLMHMDQFADAESLGEAMIQSLLTEDLKSVLVFSDGMLVNGSDLVNGMNNNRTSGLVITGGLAGNGTAFSTTLTGLNGDWGEGRVVGIGFYGTALEIGHGSVGGWEEFGHEREITQSKANVLFEIGGKNALELYKEYLGPYKEELPGSALLFPLSIYDDNSNRKTVRTILSLREDEQSMTFAGNMPIGSRVRLMKSSFDKLIHASSQAAADSRHLSGKQQPELSLLISCVGRKLVLQDRTDEEVESAADVLGENSTITGFYSYGEITQFAPFSACDLQNQTMTITTFREKIIDV